MHNKPAQVATLLACVLLMAFATGCRSFINLFGIQTPLRMALVTDNPADLLNPFSPYDPLLKKMSGAVGQPVRLEPCFAFQAGPQLSNGWYRLAIATPAQLAQFGAVEDLHALAITYDGKNVALRPAVLIVKADSGIKAVEDLRGKRVSFGPQSNSRTYHAAMALIRAHGLTFKDLAQGEMLVQPLWRHEPNVLRRAQMVLDGTVDAAFIDQAEWLALPERDQREGEPCRTKLRAVARTIELPDLFVLGSPKLTADRLSRVRIFLLMVGEQHPEVMEPLGYRAFESVDKAVAEACRGLVTPTGDEVPPAEPEPELVSPKPGTVQP
ncbi:MAG: PhnD/SsuA/transferrin family substrate-binding protein [Phycisphaerae bacterium]|nr:PhnD/SsuA/transferrin family substrate-binding protein [Phycisphaerae bacterium]